MSEQPKEAAKETPEGAGAPEDATTAKGGPPLIMMIGAIVLALAAGGALGGLVVGPRFIPAPHAAASSDDHDASADGEEEEGGHGGGGAHGGGGGAHGKKGKNHTYDIENIIVNPAGSGGTRFLMATIAFELSDDKAASRLRSRDVQVRDVVIGVLESKSLVDMTRPGSRDAIKKDLHDAVKPLAGQAAWMRVYLPQFVLQ